MTSTEEQGVSPDIYKELWKMDKHKFHASILQCMVYPTTKKLDTNDKPIVTAKYHCSGPGTCDFQEVLDKIRSHPELRAYGSQKVLDKIVGDIAQNTEDHLAAKLDGFQIYRCGIDLIRLQRVDDNGEPCTDSRTGFIEWNDARDGLSREWERMRMQIFHDAVIKAASPWWTKLFS